MFRRTPKPGTCTYTPASDHLSNTTAKRRGIAERLQGQLRETAEIHDVTIIGGDLNPCAYRERGKAKLSSVEEARVETLLIPPPDVVPMWGHIEESEDCCGITVTTTNATNWTVATHGSLQLNNEKLQRRATDQGAHLPAFMHLCEIHTAERVRAVRLPKNTEGKRGEERHQEKRKEKRQARAH